jgi:hypothetical protein
MRYRWFGRDSLLLFGYHSEVLILSPGQSPCKTAASCRPSFEIRRNMTYICLLLSARFLGLDGTSCDLNAFYSPSGGNAVQILLLFQSVDM